MAEAGRQSMAPEVLVVEIETATPFEALRVLAAEADAITAGGKARVTIVLSSEGVSINVSGRDLDQVDEQGRSTRKIVCCAIAWRSSETLLFPLAILRAVLEDCVEEVLA